ncbi:EF-hand domain-containing protein [Caulobacter sp. S45]|uniref:EF-hand domain-containing protein n=1 Tax=Caulobacter sp. S45 TaxID=1641861 RepID=UPI00131B1719|nr:EF-hand domain-containing protein [Caulobacter sp. S45]
MKPDAFRWALAGAGGAVLCMVIGAMACAQISHLSMTLTRLSVSSADFLFENITQGQTREGFVMSVMSPLRRADRSGDGLDRTDIAYLAQQEAAQRRAQRFMEVLRYDLNGDLRVTRAEIETAQPSYARRPAGYVQTMADRLMDRYDQNHHGVIDIHEIVTAQDTGNYWEDHERTRLEQLLSLGGNRLTAAALERIAEKSFDSVDTDHNGTISEDEYKAVRARIGPDFRRQSPGHAIGM